MYAIKVEKTGRYIDWFNECWYTTTSEPAYNYTQEEAKKAIDTLQNHYVYTIIVVGEDGSDERITAIKDRKVIFGKNGLPHTIKEENIMTEETNKNAELDDFEF